MDQKDSGVKSSNTLFGHPTGLYALFFAEMWERFSYYGMRSLLVFYMMKGFLGYNDNDAYTVYGAYTALVYMTPFFGGMLSDRLLGPRRTVIIGGLLMAAGQLLLTVQNDVIFFTALALLICGNGCFKPNISTMVGSLYPQGSSRRDGGFTIFYMGVNLGAAMSPLLCGFIGETYGWHWGFSLATIGMLAGLVVFWAPTLLAQIIIGTGALTAATALCIFGPEDPLSVSMRVFIAAALVAAGIIACVALWRGGIPAETGVPPDRERLRRPVLGPFSAQWVVYLSIPLAVAVFVLFVSGFAPFTQAGRSVTLVPASVIESIQTSQAPLHDVVAVVVKEVSHPAGLVLMLSGLLGLGYIGVETFRLSKIPREKMFVVLILTFFAMMFFSFFEQAGSSLNNFTDRNVDRVFARRTVTQAEVGSTIEIQPTQKQLGYHNGDRLFTLDQLDKLRSEHKRNPSFTIPWKIVPGNVGMGIADRVHDIPASVFQAVNPIYILVFGLAFTALWSFLANRGWEPSTPVKFASGLLQLGLGFGAFWLGAQMADSRGMVALSWLLLGYLLHTTGELCVSPVGLSMVTKLTPTRLVATVMGTWFLALAFSQLLAAIIAQFTGVTHGGEGGAGVIPPPIETVGVYGAVFGKIALAAIASAVICFLLAPLLTRWMHEEESTESP